MEAGGEAWPQEETKETSQMVAGERQPLEALRGALHASEVPGPAPRIHGFVLQLQSVDLDPSWLWRGAPCSRVPCLPLISRTHHDPGCCNEPVSPLGLSVFLLLGMAQDVALHTLLLTSEFQGLGGSWDRTDGLSLPLSPGSLAGRWWVPAPSSDS